MNSVLHYVYFITVCSVAFFLVEPVRAQSNVTDTYREKYRRTAETLRSWGIEAELNSDSTSISISTRGLEKCKAPVCRKLRRLSAKAGTIIVTLQGVDPAGSPLRDLGREVSIVDRPGKWEHRISINPDHAGYRDFYEGKHFVLRHELQHALLFRGQQNHFFNGVFSLRNVGPEGPSSSYWDTFLIQEFFTFVDGNRRSDLGLSGEARMDYRSFGEPMIERLLVFMRDAEKTAIANQIDFVNREKIWSTETNKIENVMVRQKQVSEAKLHAVMVKNHDPSYPEKYKMILFDKSGATYSFYSDYPYDEIKDQIPEMLGRVRAAGRVWFDSIYTPHRPQVTEDDWRAFKKAFKDNSDKFRWKPGCAEKFGKVAGATKVP